MQGLVGLVVGRDLPLDEAVHAHEACELFGNEGKASSGKYGRIACHYFCEVTWGFIFRTRLVEKKVDGRKRGAEQILPGKIGRDGQVALAMDDGEHEFVDECDGCFELGADLPRVD